MLIKQFSKSSICKTITTCSLALSLMFGQSSFTFAKPFKSSNNKSPDASTQNRRIGGARNGVSLGRRADSNTSSSFRSRNSNQQALSSESVAQNTHRRHSYKANEASGYLANRTNVGNIDSQITQNPDVTPVQPVIDIVSQSVIFNVDNQLSVKTDIDFEKEIAIVNLNSIFSSIIETQTADYKAAQNTIAKDNNLSIDLQYIDPQFQLAVLLSNRNNELFVDGMNELIEIAEETKTEIEVDYDIKAEINISRKVKKKFVKSIANPTVANIEEVKGAMYETMVNSDGIAEAKGLTIDENGVPVLTADRVIA